RPDDDDREGRLWRLSLRTEQVRVVPLLPCAVEEPRSRTTPPDCCFSELSSNAHVEPTAQYVVGTRRVRYPSGVRGTRNGADNVGFPVKQIVDTYPRLEVRGEHPAAGKIDLIVVARRQRR